MDSLIKRDPFKDWDPFRELNEFQNRLGSFFGLAPSRRGQEGFMSSEWAPSVDIIEDDREYLVKAELSEVNLDQYLAASGWQVLFPKPGEAEHAIARASLHRSLERLPSVLKGLV